MKVLILGHARHGKDTFAEFLGIRFKSSSVAALDMFLFDKLNEIRSSEGLDPYQSAAQAFDDRGKYRSTWYEQISLYNIEDPARLAKAIVSDSDCYVGMRNNTEYQACIDSNIFDRIYWVDASARKPREDPASMSIEFDPELMTFIDNNKTLEHLKSCAEMCRAEMYGEI